MWLVQVRGGRSKPWAYMLHGSLTSKLFYPKDSALITGIGGPSGCFPSPFTLKARDMAHPTSTYRAIHRHNHAVFMLWVYLPTSLSPKDIAGCGIIKLNVSRWVLRSFVVKEITSTVVHLLDNLIPCVHVLWWARLCCMRFPKHLGRIFVTTR